MISRKGGEPPRWQSKQRSPCVRVFAARRLCVTLFVCLSAPHQILAQDREGRRTHAFRLTVSAISCVILTSRSNAITRYFPSSLQVALMVSLPSWVETLLRIVFPFPPNTK